MSNADFTMQSGIVYKPVSITQMLETLDYTVRIGSTPTILYFDLYIYSAYAARYVYEKNKVIVI